MSIASLTQFQNEVMQDSALQEQFKTAATTSPESLGELALKLGSERGYNFTLEEIQATVEAASSNPSVEEELTDQELEMVSGGCGGGIDDWALDTIRRYPQEVEALTIGKQGFGKQGKRI